MESRPQNPEFRNIPENFHPCKLSSVVFGDLSSLVFILLRKIYLFALL